MNYSEENHVSFVLDVQRPIDAKQRVYHNFLPDDVQEYLLANQMYQPDYVIKQEDDMTTLYLDNGDAVIIETEQHYLDRQVEEGINFFFKD